MNRSRLSFLLLSLLVLLPLIGGAVMARNNDEGEDSLFKYLSVFQDVLRLVRQAYVEEVTVEQLMDGALDGAGDALDPFSTYVPAESVEEYRQVLEIGSRHSGLVAAKDRGVAYLISVVEGSPADDAGLQRGDIITAIGEDSTRSMPLWRLQASLAGEPGLVVPLSILREGVASEVELTLAQHEPDLVDLSEVEGTPVLRILVLGDGTAEAIASALDTLESSSAEKGMLIDLRETVSQDIESAYDVARYFATGELGSLASHEGVIDSFLTDGEPLWAGDLAVLQGRGSIAGAEVLASILQESAGATVVGQTSFGYAGRLSLTPLSSGAHVLLTDAFYSGPDGEPIREGLTPDVEVTERTRSYAEKDLALEDLTLERALGVLRGDVELSDAA